MVLISLSFCSSYKAEFYSLITVYFKSLCDAGYWAEMMGGEKRQQGAKAAMVMPVELLLQAQPANGVLLAHAMP